MLRFQQSFKVQTIEYIFYFYLSYGLTRSSHISLFILFDASYSSLFHFLFF